MKGRRVHILKTWPEFFQAVDSFDKNFEIRKNDRDFKVGDILTLVEFDPKDQTFSGAFAKRTVTYMTDFGQPPGQVVLSLNSLPKGLSCGRLHPDVIKKWLSASNQESKGEG